jgi:hypothetical protein
LGIAVEVGMGVGVPVGYTGTVGADWSAVGAQAATEIHRQKKRNICFIRTPNLRMLDFNIASSYISTVSGYRAAYSKECP